MRKSKTLKLILIALICTLSFSQNQAQTSKADKRKSDSHTVNKEITAALITWNDAAKSRDIKQFMALYDTSPDIMIIGSDSGEVFKGREQIEKWATKLFRFASFSWDMKRIDIDSNENTAWVFMDGYMVVTNDKGNTRKFPYRFTGILVKVKNSWKWRLFNGSVPGGH
jgi:ketosteroid isomerase-like protein